MAPSNWQMKKDKAARFEFEKDLQTRSDDTTKNVATSAGMGGGEQELFDKKLSKEEKKSRAKAAREAKKKLKGKGKSDDEEEDQQDAAAKAAEVLAAIHADGVKGSVEDDGIDFDAADALAAAGTICTFSASRKGVDARSRDINVQNFSLQHMGSVLLDESQIILNHGNRYGLIGRNGCGKSTLLRALGARAVPIPRGIDIFYLSEEIEPSDTVTALDAVMSVDEERLRLEKQADELNHILTELADKAASGDVEDSEDNKTPEEQQEEIMEALNNVYERLDALDAATAEVRARSILKGLGFTHAMQSKLTKDFSGGWRMRVSLARALFIQPVCLLLDGTYRTFLVKCQVSTITITIAHFHTNSLTISFSFRRTDQSFGYGSRHLVGRLLVALETYLALGVAFARLFEQCVFAHDSLYQPQENRILRWKLRPIHENQERKGRESVEAVQVGTESNQFHEGVRCQVRSRNSQERSSGAVQGKGLGQDGSCGLDAKAGRGETPQL
jgi:ABC-type cobalamin/Fe3+-siderophores transport system ATPase subunit